MDPPPYTPRAHDAETASIRSAAPSYVSAVPSYRSTVPTSLPSPYNSPATPLPRVPTTPSLSAFRAPPSPAHNRHYHSVAARRASSHTALTQSTLLAAAINGEDAIAAMKRKMDAESRARDIRTSEDPLLVGEKAAREAKQERLRRENGWEVLEREDKWWDWLLAQMSDWEERNKSWARFRKEVEEGKRTKLARRMGIHQ